MRSELLKTSEVPISSDWPNAGSSDPKGFEAAKKLIARLDGPGDDILPFTFADRLAGMPIDVYSGDLVLLLHMAGINVRFMGLVYRRLRERHPNSDWCCRVATEILARSFRKVVNNELRTCTANTDGLGCGTAKFDFSFSEEAETTEGDGEYIDENVIAQIITYCLNNFFTKSSESADLMNAINNDITNRFVFKNTEEKEYVHRFTTEDMVVRPDGSDIESYKNGIPTFMLLTTEFFNLEWYNDVWDSFMKGGKEFFSGVAPFHHRSLKGIMPRVKEMNIAHHSNGIAMEKFYFTFKKQKRTKAIAIPRYIFNSVTENFRLALLSMPSNSNSLRRYAKALSEELENIADDDSVGEDERARREKLRSKLDAIYTRIARDNTDYSLYYAAVYYDKKGDIKTARDLYRRSLEINPTQGNCYLMCADTLTFPSDKSLADTKEGKKLYLEGIKKDDMGKCKKIIIITTQTQINTLF